MKPRIFLTRSLPPIALDKLKDHFDVSLNTEDRVLEKSEIIEKVKNVDALLCLLTDTIDKAVIDAGKNLKVISNYAVGYNNIDIKEATLRKLPVCITPGILTNAVADLTFGLILAVTRRIVESDQFTRAHLFKGWGPNLFLGSEVHGKTLGIVGMGRIGQAVLKRALGFDMNVVYTSSRDYQIEGAKFVPLKELLQISDIISLHTPLTPTTRHMIGVEEFKLMKKEAFIINTTRGAVIDEIALVDALTHNRIAGAGLDVYENEPELTPGLVELKNVVLLPHIGSATIETRTKMAILAVENAIAILEGHYPHAIVNPEVLETS